MDRARSTATFTKIEIDNTEINEGNFNLEFSAVDSNEPEISTVQPLLFPFKLFSNADVEAEVDRYKMIDIAIIINYLIITIIIKELCKTCYQSKRL